MIQAQLLRQRPVVQLDAPAGPPRPGAGQTANVAAPGSPAARAPSADAAGAAAPPGGILARTASLFGRRPRPVRSLKPDARTGFALDDIRQLLLPRGLPDPNIVPVHGLRDQRQGRHLPAPHLVDQVPGHLGLTPAGGARRHADMRGLGAEAGLALEHSVPSRGLQVDSCPLIHASAAEANPVTPQSPMRRGC